MGAIDYKKVEDQILKAVKEEGKSLFHKDAEEARASVKSSLENIKKWTVDLENKDLDKEEFESLVRGQWQLEKIAALTQKGLNKVEVEAFENKLTSMVFDAVINIL